MCRSSVDICELSLKARIQGSMKPVMLSSDNFYFFFLERGLLLWQHIMWTSKKYFFELYYTHMSLENTLGFFRRLLEVFLVGCERSCSTYCLLITS